MSSSHIPLVRRLALAVGALFAAFAFASAAQAQTQASPASLLPEAGNLPYLIGHGTGVQIYQCNGSAWTFVAPRADLTDVFGRVIIKHFGGPSWQANDGSKVVGTLVKSVSVNPKAIPWLLLSATDTPAPNGGGLLAHTTFVQRLLTVGGLAPAASTCTAASAGARAEVPYTSEYVFWRHVPVRG